MFEFELAIQKFLLTYKNKDELIVGLLESLTNNYEHVYETERNSLTVHVQCLYNKKNEKIGRIQVEIGPWNI